MATGRVRPTWVPPSSGDSGPFVFGTDVVADGNQSVSGIWWYQPPAPGTITDVTVGLFDQATQTLIPTTQVTIPAGSITAGTWTLGSFPAPVTMTAGVTYTFVTACGGEHGFENPAGYTIDDPTNTVHLPGPGRFQAGAFAYPNASTWDGQHGNDIEMVESAPITATLALTLPPEAMSAEADAEASATLTLTLPPVDIDLVSDADVAGTLNITLPPESIFLAAPSSAGGGSVEPCPWSIPTPPLCCSIWGDLSAEQQTAALNYATTVLWAATGRVFGLCEQTVRPCGMKRCQDGLAEFFGYDWSGGTWIPYIFNGTWYNCPCTGICCCEPRCQIRLMGPVYSVSQVTVGGVVIPSTSYRVDDDHWLVRTDGDCWPICADLDTDDGPNVFSVTYTRGTPVPAALLTAAGTLACEWAKACVGADCRLSNRVTSLARNGVQIEMVDQSQFLQDGLTGLPEVDALIQVYNPYGLKQRLRIYAPELRIPRTVTSA